MNGKRAKQIRRETRVLIAATHGAGKAPGEERKIVQQFKSVYKRYLRRQR